jgi:hypothetical protein
MRGTIEPAVRRVERDRIGLADTVAIDEVGRHQIAGRYGGGVANGER